MNVKYFNTLMFEKIRFSSFSSFTVGVDTIALFSMEVRFHENMNYVTFTGRDSTNYYDYIAEMKIYDV